MALDDELATVAVLGDDLRRGLYRYVRGRGVPVTREEAARALRISVKLAAFHLDKLVERGLLTADVAPPPAAGRRAGRAPKRYAPSGIELSLSVPERRYDVAGEILVDALAARGPDDPAVAAVRQTAWERGRELGAGEAERRRLRRPGAERAVAAAQDVLEAQGFEPAEDGAGGLVLRNCPFHRLAERAPAFVCSMNVAFIEGLLLGLGGRSVRAELAPAAGRCCVQVLPEPPAAGEAGGG